MQNAYGKELYHDEITSVIILIIIYRYIIASLLVIYTLVGDSEGPWRKNCLSYSNSCKGAST